MDEDESVINKRIAKLGFRPQKENVYNKLLPYADDLDEESTKLFQDIKSNLVKAVLAREMRPGCALWTSKLKKYIKIYGMKFSKEDHIALIKLFYELIIIPDLEPTRIHKCATTLIQLLKKTYLLSRDELVLEWRPLYDLCVRVLEKSKKDIGMYRYFSTFETTLFNVFKAAKVYFPASATQEILDEFRPHLCPFNSSEIADAIQYLDLFLPVHVKPEEASLSYDLWFEEFMTLWNVCHNASIWENRMMCLMTSLARFQTGYIDWEPYIPLMFDRFMRTLQIPVNFRQKTLGKQHKIEVSYICVWIVYVLNGDRNSGFKYFEQFMLALKSFFYPANFGRWTLKLRELLRKLTYYFVQRVHNERFKRPSWEDRCPDEFKLTDADIDRFVLILKPSIEQAMFSRIGSQDVSLALQYLASLRPNLITPMILDKLYASMDSLTEPHKLTSSMMAVIAVGRYMVQGSRNNYPEGPTHVIPLLMALLPGIDPNDIGKSYITFNFLAHFINMVPLIDCSTASNYHELTEEEHIVCEATANFEDFVLQLFDKLSQWVESSSLDFVRMEQMTNATNNSKSKMETISESAIASVSSVILYQCSPELFKTCLRKMFNFVIERVLEVQIAGRMVAVILQCFARVNPKETFNLFLPYLFDVIEKQLEESPNFATDEHIDAQLLYNLLLLSEIVHGRSELIPYMDRLTNILDRFLHVQCKHAGLFATRLLENIIASLTHITPKEKKSVAKDYASPVQNFLPIRDWGRPEKLSNLKIDWYVPGKKEIDEVQKLIYRYLIPELDKLDKFSKGELIIERNELRQILKIIVSILASQPVLPMWEEEPIQLVESVLEPYAFNLKVSGNEVIKMPDGRNVRKVIVDCMHNLQKKLLECDEGDTKSIQTIVHIYNILLFNKMRGQDFEFHWKNFHMTKKLLEDRVHQKKLHLRHLLIDRVILQQEFRIESRSCSFTATHRQILLDLFELSVSRYSEVRITAQLKLFSIISYIPYSYTILTPKFLEILSMNSEENHERFKGCLHVLIGPKNSPIVTRHDWEFIKQLWPQIVKSMPSEKPSIINLISAINESVHKFFPTIAINLVIPDSCLIAAKNLGRALDLKGWQEQEKHGEEKLKLKSESRRKAYEFTLNSLLEACENGKLNWRYQTLALSFLKDLVHFDMKYPKHFVRYFMNALIDESITVRKIALKVAVLILMQNKPAFKKITINIPHLPPSGRKTVPGIRSDNEWLLYDEATVPKTESEWQEPRFVHNQYAGYYTWPTSGTIEVYDEVANERQAIILTDESKLTETQREILHFFNNKENFEKLVKYFSMEEKKGIDQFNIYRFLIFKNLFKIFEDRFFPLFIPELEKLVKDKQESSQRCAAEIIGGLICGCKHWSFAKTMNLRAILLPILDIVLSNIYNETLTDWSLCITMGLESRDPNRYFWLLEYFMQDPLSDLTSFLAASRLHLLYVALNQQSWRNSTLLHRVLKYLDGKLDHPFQNIREKISGCLALIFSRNLIFPGCNPSVEKDIPSVITFFNAILPKIDILYQHTLKKIKSDDADTETRMEIDHKVEELSISQGGDKIDDITRLYKTIAKYVTTSVVRVNYSTIPQFFHLLPLACILQSGNNNNEVDDELSSTSTHLIVVLAQTVTIAEYIPDCINAIKLVAKCQFWSSRSIITEFISVFVFHNMSTIISRNEWISEIENVVLELLEDTQPEVRIAASKLLSGLLHCKFLTHQDRLLTNLKQKALTQLKSTDKMEVRTNIIRLRHAGVLGLCAFINAHPYDVPDYLPDIFKQLGPHLSDPQPIPATIRKTLNDFKRTHHENWDMHKLKFTEEELLVLSDLTVPPSYYA